MTTDSNQAHERVEDAARGIRAVAIYLFLAGALGLFIELPFSLVTLGLAVILFGFAWLVRTYQSRIAASIFLAGATALLARALWSIHQAPRWPQQVSQVTGLLVIGSWFALGIYSLLATTRYHTRSGAGG